ncbi:TonB-dependent siderophore receptor [Methylobacillus flagellatus]|uniref:TonB-dependent siderophore receptor n=1 Tax=Methylobacillus flagellatus TaxID=405 RepID=UPI0028538A3F|nr:TonB-dependent siderophore receptor [Methylobacillus flagellatus]MDR5172146.1 TonB-dependent siderophore receptor [Methylobacillus flagellatus]
MSQRALRLPLARQGETLPKATSLAQAIAGAVFSLSIITATVAVPSLASAAETVPSRHYRIPAGPLGTALSEFAAAAGVTLSFDPSQVAGLQSPGLQGDVTIKQGFDRITAGSGFEVVAQSATSYLLRQIPVQNLAPRDAAVSVLPELAVSISGKAPGSTTEGTGSYTTWSTSSSTRLNLTPQETPQSVTVMTRQRMDDQKLDTLVDVLDATPGVIVQRPYIGQGQDSSDIYVRGSYLSNYQIDGVPTSLAVSPLLANTAAYDRIEVVRGATGIMNGMGTPAATVNLIRKRPTATSQKSVTAQVGNWDRHGAGLDVSGPINESGTARARFVADYNRQGAWVDRFDQKNLALYGIAEFDLDEQTLLTAGFSHLSQKTDSPIQGRPLFYTNGQHIPLSPSDNATPKWNYYDHRSTGVFASLEHRFSSRWVGKVEYSQARYRDDVIAQGTTNNIDADTGNGMEIWPSHWRGQNRQDNLDAYLSGPFSLFGRNHELIGGVTLSRERSIYTRYEDDWMNYPPDFNIFDWADTAPVPTFFNTGKSSARERQYSAYLNARFQLSDAASLLLGGRSAHWKREQESTPTQRKEEVFVPYVGLVYALDDTWSVYGSYTKIFQPQDGRVYLYGASGASPDPVQGEGYEVGVKAGFYDGRLTSSLAFFQTNVENLAVWNIDAFRYDIKGQTRTRGVELELNGRLVEGWQISAGYAYARTEDENGERTLTRLPSHVLKLFTTYRLPGEWNKVTVGGGVNWQSAIHSDSVIDYRQGGVALVNLMARYEVKSNLSVSLNLNNALDKEYYSTVANNYGTFGAPRNFMASMKYTF